MIPRTFEDTPDVTVSKKDVDGVHVRLELDEAGNSVVVDPRQNTLSTRISGAFAQAAMDAANEKYLTGGRVGFAGRQRDGSFPKILRGIFVGTFVIPAAMLTIYLVFFAVDQYSVETRFAIRSVTTPMGDLLSAFGGGATKTQTAIVSKYLKSDALVRSLDSDMDLKHMYSEPDYDLFAKFNPHGSAEDLADYWRWKISVSDDNSTGLITATVTAFTPEDAVKISNGLIAKASALVKDLSAQNRQSVLALATTRLENARSKLSGKTVEMAELRNKTGVLDSSGQSGSQVKLVTALELELSTLKAKLDSLRKLSSSSVKIPIYESQIASLEQQIVEEKSKLTSQSGGSGVMSNVMADFDKLDVDQKALQNEFLSASAAFEEARTAADSQDAYLSVYTPPTLPESSVYPRRFLVWIIGIGISAAVAFSLMAIARTIRDNHAA